MTSSTMTASRPPNGTVVYSNDVPKETGGNWASMNCHCHPNGLLYHNRLLTNGIVPRLNGVTKQSGQLFPSTRHVFNRPPPEASSSSCPPPYSAEPEIIATEIGAPNSRGSVSIGSDGETSLWLICISSVVCMNDFSCQGWKSIIMLKDRMT